MSLWWIGNAVLLLVVIPVVGYLATELLRATLEIRRCAETVLADGLTLSGTLNAEVPKLVSTVQLVTTAHHRVGRYGAAIVRLL